VNSITGARYGDGEARVDRDPRGDGVQGQAGARARSFRQRHRQCGGSRRRCGTCGDGVRTIEVGKLFHAVGPGNTDESTTVQITFDASDRVIAVE
jgi:hypothetical protein